LAPKKNSPPKSDTLPFGAGTFDAETESATLKGTSRAARPTPRGEERAEERGKGKKDEEASPAPEPKPAPRGRSRAKGNPPAVKEERAPFAEERREAPPAPVEPPVVIDDDDDDSLEPEGDERAAPQESSGAPRPQGGPVDPSAPPRRSGRAERRRRWQERRRRRRLGLPLDELAPQGQGAGQGGGQGGRGHAQPHGDGHGEARAEGEPGPGAAVAEREPRDGHEGRDGRHPQEPREREPLREVEGVLVLEHANHGQLRVREREYLPHRDDVHVAPWQVQKYGLREGALVQGRYRRGQGRNRWELIDVLRVDGQDPRELRNVPHFKSLVTIDPDFHYALGDASGEVSLKVLDVLCPIGRGQRGLIVAPPRSGKTMLLQQIARAVEQIYPDVHLMVLLVDERPEEATEWKRTVQKGEVYVSTNDEPAKKHVELAELVWRRARRLVELGKDVILLLDSITRLGRAANNVWGTSGKTMSGGIDSRALERPKALFGSARNTEKAGSLTILGTTLVDTGSRMDQVIFEEFKGTGNMELVLARRLADRRIFPAIDLERSGTRKEEKLHSAKRLTRVNTLRRVLMRMHWAEAMELLITKLEDVEKIDDFLQRFDIDPDAGDEGKQAVSPVRMRW